MTWVWWIGPLAVAPIVLGFLVGWLVGASQTPVVAVALPLLVGLLGAVGFGVVEQRFASDAVANRVMELGVVKNLSQPDRASIEAALHRQPDRPQWVPTLWSVGVIGFCIACFVGLEHGTERRFPSYGRIADLVGEEPVPPDRLAVVYALRWQHRASGVPREESDDLIRRVFVPLLRESTEDRMYLLRETFHLFDTRDQYARAPAVLPPWNQQEVVQ